MKTAAIIEKSEKGYSIYTPDLGSVIIGLGETVELAKDDFANSLKEVIESYDGEELPVYLKDIEFDYRFDIQSLFNLYNFINVSKFAKRIGINPSLLSQYKNGLTTYITEQQAKKIEKAFHDIGNEFTKISLR